jgi:hypothetical protein
VPFLVAILHCYICAFVLWLENLPWKAALYGSITLEH